MTPTYFLYYPYYFSIFISPNIISDDVTYKWYINDNYYSDNKVICIIPDSFDINVKLEIYDENNDLVQTITDIVNYKPFYKINNTIATKTFEDINFICFYESDTEKIIAILPKQDYVENSSFNYIISNIEPKKHNLSKSDVTITKICDNVYKLSDFTDDFGLQYNTAEIWFPINNNYELITKNNNINKDVDVSGYNEINYINKFYDPINSIHLLSKGNSEQDNSIFTFYSKQNEIIDEHKQKNTYYIDENKFDINDGDDYTYTSKKKLYEMNKPGYIIYDNYIEVIAPYETTFEHRNVEIENVKSVIVQNNQTCLVINYYDKNGNKVPILIPPCRKLQSIDKIKVTDKISIENVKCIRYENDIFYYFKENKHVYIKPHIPGLFTINKLITENGVDDNILITTNKECILKTNDKTIISNDKKMVYDNKIYTIEDDILIHNSGYTKTDINNHVDIDKGYTSLHSDLHVEKSFLEFKKYTDYVIFPNDIIINNKVFEYETRYKLMRKIDYNKIFRQDVKINTRKPFMNYILYYIDCSYRVIIPYIKGDNITGFYDKRLMVL